MKGLRTRVYLEFDRMGNLIVTPSKKFKKVWSGKTWDDDQALTEGAFLQLSQEQEPVINAIGREARRWLKRIEEVLEVQPQLSVAGHSQPSLKKKRIRILAPRGEQQELP